MRISQQIKPFVAIVPTRSLFAIVSGILLLAQLPRASGGQQDALDQQLTARLQELGFSGEIGSSIGRRMGWRSW